MHRTFLVILAIFLGVSSSLSAEPIVELLMKDGETEQIVKIQLLPERAPVTVENFLTLAKRGFYKGTSIHRVVFGVLVQMGDPYSKRKDAANLGTGGPGYTLPAEIGGPVKKGAVAMGRLPNALNPSKASNGSQFFVALRNMPEWNGEYTVFGQVVEGLEFLEEVSRRRADANDVPYQPVIIRKTTIIAE